MSITSPSERVFLAQQRAQSHSPYYGHDEEERAVVVTEVIDRHDRWMIHLRNKFGFVLESLLRLGVKHRRGDQLDRNLTIKQRVARAIDDTHATAAQFAVISYRLESFFPITLSSMEWCVQPDWRGQIVQGSV
jgi:hypothetical protein